MKFPAHLHRYRNILITSLFLIPWQWLYSQGQGTLLTGSGVTILNIDADRPIGKISEGIYGQFLEHINHSVVDGLFAEQVQGCGFEGKDFETYWKPYGEKGSATVVSVKFKNGSNSLQIKAEKGYAGVRQNRVYLQAGQTYDGSLWAENVTGSLSLLMRFRDSSGRMIRQIPLKVSGTGWNEIPYSFTSPITDPQVILEIEGRGTGTLLVDFISLMRADVRKDGMLRPDLFKALEDLNPPFLRWPGGSFASVYKWKDGIGPHAERKYNPNIIWGGYSDYYGFGTHEYLELCRRLKAEPLICLPATSTKPEDVRYAIDWIHYINDPVTTEWGRLRAKNGHPEPYNVKYFQIDNEPMNHNLTPEQYSEIVNVYGSEIRKIDPGLIIVACGQKRSNDLSWSQKVIDIAGDNFDILGCHNYEYENENYQTGIQRIAGYLINLSNYISNSRHPNIKIAVLEWGLCRSYDWKAGLHTAGSLILYEKLGNELVMTCPALLMRNTEDDPTWTAFIYHDHVTWFPAGGYYVEKLFRQHYAENFLASASGTFSDIPDRSEFFDSISQMKPTDWKPGTVDAIATSTSDGKKIIIKAVNYENYSNTLLTRINGSNISENAEVKITTITAGIDDHASLQNPDAIKPEVKAGRFSRYMEFVMNPYSVILVEISFN
ncbi:MAG: carbohydrate binding domain-containing protein [Bacteroidales bacterium]|nr:carbohydrate binding domain-containing protein [Bacteroidales bacterium]